MNFLIYILFFLSGACGLVYEVVWSRMLTLIFGRSALSIGIVLAAFMSGLAIGSYALGKLADRSRNPLRLYALYELLVGLTAFLASFFLTRTGPLHVWIHDAFGSLPVMHTAVRFLTVFTVMIVPTTLMGATLPILSRLFITRLNRVGDQLGRLYAINTVGAVAGSFVTGFYLIGSFGLHKTINGAVLGNLLVAAAAWLTARFINAPQTGAPASAPVAPKAATGDNARTLSLMLWAFALSGMTSFAYEIFWTRSLVFLLGNTTYAFTLMLMAFLSGISLGGFGIRFLADRIKSPIRLFAAIEILIGIFSAAALPLLFFIVKSDAVNSFIARYSGSLDLLAAADFVIALSLMLLPATLIGATLPLMAKIFMSDLNNTGATIGKIYAVNTIGNVAGALLPGLIIMPLIGIQKGILLMAIVNLMIGGFVLFSGKRPTVIAAVGLLLFLALSAVLVRLPISFQFPSQSQRSRDEAVFYREGGLATTKVWKSTDTGYKEISVDGINIGGTGDSDYKQQILAHLPKLLLKKYQSELTIGLGSGILAGESGRHADLKKIVCVEILHGVVDGARFFKTENYDVLNDSRVSIVTDDVADYLQTSRDTFDIISADEKTAGKYATNSFSYSSEYYGLLKQHLAPGGLVIQWMPADLPPSQYLLALRTFFSAFPHAQLWYFPPVGRFTMTNTFLIGSNEAVDIDYNLMRRRLEADPDAFQGIRKYGLTTAESLLAHFVGSEETVRADLPPGPLNTFEEPYYEFYSPGDYAVPPDQRALQNHMFLTSFGNADFIAFVLKGRTGEEARRLQTAYAAEQTLYAGRRNQLMGMPEESVLPYYELALRNGPANRNLRNEMVSYLNVQYLRVYTAGEYSRSLAFLARAVQIYPESSEVHYDYGWMLGKMERNEEAVHEMELAIAIDPRCLPAHRTLASLYAASGQTDKASEQWKTALSLDSDDVPTLVGYGIFLAQQGLAGNALNYVRKAYELDSVDPDVIDGYARVAYLHGDMKKARCIVNKGGGYFKGNPFFEQLRTAILNTR